MAKREIPLFIFDNQRKHSDGAYDNLVCKDKDNGFVARIDYVEGVDEMTTDTVRVGLKRNGIAMRMEIKRFTVSNVKNSEVRVLKKLCMDYCAKVQTLKVDYHTPSVEKFAAFHQKLIVGNRANLWKLSPVERATTERSLAMLTVTMNHLKQR